MDGLAVGNDIYKLATAIGIIPTLMIVGVCVFFLFREIRKANEAQAKQTEEIKSELAKINEKIDGMQNEYVSKEQHYKDVGGWRSELDDVRKLVIQTIRDGAKNGGN